MQARWESREGPRTPGRSTDCCLSEARGPRVGSVPRRDPCLRADGPQSRMSTPPWVSMLVTRDAPGSQSLFHGWLPVHVPGQASRPRNGVGTLGRSEEGPNSVHSLHHLGPGAQLKNPPWQGCGQDVAVPKGQEPRVGLAALLSLLSADSRALPSAQPAKPEFSDFPLAGSRRASEALFIWLSEKKGE